MVSLGILIALLWTGGFEAPELLSSTEVGYDGIALGAAMLLGVNIVCVNLAAQTVFVAKGIRPRTWWEQKASATSLRINFVMWLALLMALVAAIYWLKLPVLPPQLAGPGAEIAGE